MIGDVASKPNSRVAAIRENMPVMVKEEVPKLYGTSDRIQAKALSYIKRQERATAFEVCDGIGCPKGTIHKVMHDLEVRGCIYDTGEVKGKSKIYRYAGNPFNWNLDAPIEVVVRTPKKKAIRDFSDNALTRALEKIDPVVIKTDGYRQFIKDTSKLYGIQELDDIVMEVHNLCKERVVKGSKCPICYSNLVFDGTGCGCQTCNISINVGEPSKSAEVFQKMCKSILEVM